MSDVFLTDEQAHVVFDLLRANLPPEVTDAQILRGISAMRPHMVVIERAEYHDKGIYDPVRVPTFPRQKEPTLERQLGAMGFLPKPHRR